jgi:hypothetical protein
VKPINRLLRGKTILALAGCGILIGGAAVASSSAKQTPVSSIPSGAGPGWPPTISPGDFAREVTNPWFPLKPGSVWRYKGLKEGMKTTDIVTATHQTKKILGVTTTVVHDVVSVKGRPEEVTNDFYAQDRHGNVWYFGEETEGLNAHGKPTSTEGQEFLKGEAEDHFQVLDLKASVSVPFVSSRRALRTREWTPLEPATVDNKYYVRGVGTVREIAVKGPVEKLELVSYKAG